MFRITPVYDRLLRGSDELPVGLYHLQLATAEQLCRLHYAPASLKLVKKRLKLLADNGFVQADSIPTKQFKSPYYYTLAQKGAHYLSAAGLDIPEAFRASKETNKHALFIDHTLELNDLIISAALLRRANSDYYLDSFIHERVLKRMPYRDKHVTLIPDAFMDFRVISGDGRRLRMAVLLEHDRGTEEQQYFRRRIRAYIGMLHRQGHKELFGVGAVTVAFSTFAGTQRLEQMRQWTRAELSLSAESQSVCLSFYFAALTRPLDPCATWLQPFWFTVLSGNPQALLAL